MPIYRRDEVGQFTAFEHTAFPDLEKLLEDWIEGNPHVLLENQPLVLIGRQMSTGFGKVADLLGVDVSGACVVIELKKGMAPREVIAQTMEYAAWVDSLNRDDLDNIAKTYAEKNGVEAEGVWDLYRRAFESELEDEEEPLSESKVTFNAQQRLVIVAESFPPEMEQTLRYLRSKLGVDISAVRFRQYRLGDDVLLETEIVVGREWPAATREKSPSAKPPKSHEEIKAKAKTQFVQDQVDGLEEWVYSLGIPGLEVHHNQGSSHSLWVGDKSLGGWYFGLAHVHFWLRQRRPGDERLREVSDSSSALLLEKAVRGNIANERDLELYKAAVLARVET